MSHKSIEIKNKFGSLNIGIRADRKDGSVLSVINYTNPNVETAILLSNDECKEVALGLSYRDESGKKKRYTEIKVKVDEQPCQFCEKLNKPICGVHTMPDFSCFEPIPLFTRSYHA